MQINDEMNEHYVVESVIQSLGVHKYEQIDINDELIYVPTVILEVIDSLNQQLEEAGGFGLSHN